MNRTKTTVRAVERVGEECDDMDDDEDGETVHFVHALNTPSGRPGPWITSRNGQNQKQTAEQSVVPRTRQQSRNDRPPMRCMPTDRTPDHPHP